MPTTRTDESPVPPEVSDVAHFYATVRWLDTHGRMGSINVFAEKCPNARVWAYARADDGPPVLVGMLRSDHKFLRLEHTQAALYGLDTSAAWNNLIEVCRAAHLAHQ